MKQQISVVANLFCKMFVLEEKGEILEEHEHTFDHQTLLAHGSVLACIPGKEPRVLHAPKVLMLKAGTRHSFEAVTDNVVLCCLHALRKSEVIDDVFDPEDCPSLWDAYPLQQSDPRIKTPGMKEGTT